MKTHILFALFFFTCSIANLRAQIYSFEDGLVPTNCTVSLGSLQASTMKYKIGTKSLKWDWKANDVLNFSNPNGLTIASTSASGGILLWIYNPPPQHSLWFLFLKVL